MFHPEFALIQAKIRFDMFVLSSVWGISVCLDSGFSLKLLVTTERRKKMPILA